MKDNYEILWFPNNDQVASREEFHISYGRIPKIGHLFLVISAALIIVLAAAIGIHNRRDMLLPISLLSGLVGIGIILYARYCIGLAWMSISVLFLMQLWLYNFGLTFIAVFVPSVISALKENTWYYLPPTRMALLMSLLAMTSYTLGVVIMHKNVRKKISNSSIWPHDSSLYIIGWTIMLLGLLGSLGHTFLMGGFGVLNMGYIAFRERVLNTGLMLFFQGSQIGCLFAICGAGGKRWIKPLLLWCPVGIFMLLFGLRNEVLIPLIIFSVILVLRGIKFKKRFIWLVLAILFFAIPAIRIFRTVGFGNRGLVSWTEVTPLETFVEVGGSIRAVQAYINWIDEGDDYLYGASYWAPFDRQFLVWVLPWRERVPASLDRRVPSEMMYRREGAVGTSTVGEAYYNFGIFGPLIYFTAIGMLLQWLVDRVRISNYGLAALGCVVLPIYWSIRSQFLMVPLHIFVAFLLLGICRLFHKRRASSIFLGYN
jgi:oligosaccharide repeat unit polymerase